MSSRALAAVTAADGPAALPRRNGELVFEAPWQSRAFGVAIALHDAGAVDFEAFRSRLIAEISRQEQGDEMRSRDAGYYERWLEALEDVLVQRELVSRLELEARAAEIAHAWDHDHDHHHLERGEHG